MKFSIENPNGGHEKDPVGSVFQTQNGNFTADKNGKYIGNVISNAQLLVAKAIFNNEVFLE